MTEFNVPGWLATAWMVGGMVSAPNPEFTQRTFAIGTITGIRCWKIDRKAEALVPVSTMIPYTWCAGVNNAWCHRNRIQLHWEEPADHRLMGLGCTCGFYAYYCEAHTYRNNASIEGVIEGFGRCVVGSRGFRCERAIVRALVHPEPDAMNMLFSGTSKDEREEVLWRIAQRYGVPLFDTSTDMLKHFPLTEPEKV